LPTWLWWYFWTVWFVVATVSFCWIALVVAVKGWRELRELIATLRQGIDGRPTRP
jgi:hypothetical protein